MKSCFERVFSIAGSYWERYKHFVKYCLIGASGATLDFVLFTLLTKKWGMFYQYANGLSVTLGITNNFFLNAFVNFKKRDKLWLRFMSFYAVGMVGLGISAIFLFAFVKLLHLNVLFSKFITIFVVTICQYTLNKAISFKTYRQKEIENES